MPSGWRVVFDQRNKTSTLHILFPYLAVPLFLPMGSLMIAKSVHMPAISTIFTIGC